MTFIRTKRNPTLENIAATRETLEGHADETGWVDVSRLVYASHLGLVEYWTTTGKWPDCANEVPYNFKAECEKVSDVAKEEFGF